MRGGGQITEIEGAKATQAVGRLDSAQKPEDYVAALQELRDLLVTAQSRPVGWAETAPLNENAPPANSTSGSVGGVGWKVVQ